MKFKNHTDRFNENWRKAIRCFLAAVVVYTLISFVGVSKRCVTMPLEIIMPDGFKATSLVPQKADVIIEGSEKQIYMIDVKKIKLCADFSSVEGSGIASAAVQINYQDLRDYIDTTDISIFTKPSIVKMYFEN